MVCASITAPAACSCLKYPGSPRIALIVRNSVTGMCAALINSMACGCLIHPSSMVRNATFWVVGMWVSHAASGPAGKVILSAGGAGGNWGMLSGLAGPAPGGQPGVGGCVDEVPGLPE